jgi:hypothetical protein
LSTINPALLFLGSRGGKSANNHGEKRNIVTYIKTQRLAFLGHLGRMHEERERKIKERK